MCHLCFGKRTGRQRRDEHIYAFDVEVTQLKCSEKLMVQFFAIAANQGHSIEGSHMFLDNSNIDGGKIQTMEVLEA